MAVHSQPLTLPELLPAGCRGFAVLDLETTGSGRLCRIVEIALLLLSPEGELQQEWRTLSKSGVPIPNAAVHGIDDALASSAPVFADVAPELASLLHVRVLVAHNLDRGFGLGKSVDRSCGTSSGRPVAATRSWWWILAMASTRCPTPSRAWASSAPPAASP